MSGSPVTRECPTACGKFIGRAKANYPSSVVNRASQIQLCPGFLKETQKGKVQSLQGQGKKSSLARGWKKFTSWVDDPFRTPMDVAYTFDATILHEMTHAVPNAATEDAGGKGDSYGKFRSLLHKSNER
jgi:hypothetical protein